MATYQLPVQPHQLTETEMDSFTALLHLADPNSGWAAQHLEEFLKDPDEEALASHYAVVQPWGRVPVAARGQRGRRAAVQFPPPLPEVLSDSLDSNTTEESLEDCGASQRLPLKVRRKKDRAAPKKPRSAYIVFLDRHREKLRQQRPDLKMKEVTAELAKGWRSISPQEKATCEVIAKREIEQYRMKKDLYLQQKQLAISDCDGGLNDIVFKPKAKRRKKDKGAPRKGRSAFILFLMDFRAINKQANNSSAAFSSVSKQVSSAWTSLTDAERQPYLDRAAKEAEEYRIAKTKYLAEKSSAELDA